MPRCQAICAAAAPMTSFNAVAAACAGQFDGGVCGCRRMQGYGAAKYTVDIRHDGQQEGVILRSQLAHATGSISRRRTRSQA